MTTTLVSSFASHGFADVTQIEPESAAITPDSKHGVFSIQNPANDTALAGRRASAAWRDAHVLRFFKRLRGRSPQRVGNLLTSSTKSGAIAQ